MATSCSEAVTGQQGGMKRRLLSAPGPPLLIPDSLSPAP